MSKVSTEKKTNENSGLLGYIINLFKNNWLIYAVLFSMLPVIIVVFIDWYFGYTVVQIVDRHFADFVLVTLAIGANLHSLAKDRSKDGERTFAVICVIICIAYYTFSYTISNIEQIGLHYSGNKIAVVIAKLFITIICFLIVKIGWELEKSSQKTPQPHKRRKKK